MPPIIRRLLIKLMWLVFRNYPALYLITGFITMVSAITFAVMGAIIVLSWTDPKFRHGPDPMPVFLSSMLSFLAFWGMNHIVSRIHDDHGLNSIDQHVGMERANTTSFLDPDWPTAPTPAQEFSIANSAFRSNVSAANAIVQLNAANVVERTQAIFNSHLDPSSLSGSDDALHSAFRLALLRLLPPGTVSTPIYHEGGNVMEIDLDLPIPRRVTIHLSIMPRQVAIPDNNKFNFINGESGEEAGPIPA